MKSNELNKQIQKLSDLSVEQKDALLTIIDSKIENDMERILLRIDANSKEIASIRNELNTKIDSIKWFVLSAMALLGLVMAILKFFF